MIAAVSMSMATPRQRAEKAEWSPPSQENNHQVTYSLPGKMWMQWSQKKLFLLESLRGFLVAAGLLEQPMTFNVVDGVY